MISFKELLENLKVPAVIMDGKGKQIVWNAKASDVNGNLNVEVLAAINGASDEVLSLALAEPKGYRLVILPSFFEHGDITRSIKIFNSSPFHLTMLDNSEISVTITDNKGDVLLFSKGSEAITGYKADEVVGKMNVKDFYKDKDELLELQRELEANGKTQNRKVTLTRKDGSSRKTIINLAELRDQAGNVSGSMAVAIDVTKEEYLFALSAGTINALETALAAVEAGTGKIILCNRAFADAFLQSQDTVIMREQYLFDVAPQLIAHEQEFARCSREGKAVFCDREEFKDKGQSEGYRKVSFYPIFENKKVAQIVVRIDDLTAEVRLQKIMVAAEKMNSIAGLAAGMAHEINNPLSGIIQSAELLRRNFDIRNEKIRRRLAELGYAEDNIRLLDLYLTRNSADQLLQNILRASERVTKIIGGLLEFSRKKNLERKPYRVSEVMNKALELASAYPAFNQINDLRVSMSPRFENMMISADLPQLLHVLLQVLHNGVEKLKEKENSDDKPADWKPSLSISYEQKNDCGVIIAKDNGAALPPETVQLAFEPFFSTDKEILGGGLGLAVARFILTEFLQGDMTISSGPAGTSYKISLPLA